MRSYDVLVVGGGIAGVSIAYEIASDRSVCVLEMASTLATHTTGRSAATFVESLGDKEIRGLTRSSRAFYENPPEPFDTRPLSPLPLLMTATADHADAVRTMHAEVSVLTPDARIVDGREALQLDPLLRPGYADLALLEPSAMAIDVHAVHQGYVKGLRQRGGVVRASARLVSATHKAGRWTVTDATGETYEAAVLVDAAGAWADAVAGTAGVRPIGIRPLLRTIFVVDAPDHVDTTDLPMTADIGDTFYVKPEKTRLLCSPADETPTPPCDAKPAELTIARALDTINDATVANARHVRTSWAGLRSFAPDRHPVIGFDDRADGFFWCAGQGGFGIQTAPALARAGAALLRGENAPADILANGERIAASRFADR